MRSGDRVRVVDGSEFAGRAATVVQDLDAELRPLEAGRGRVYVLIDGAGENPVPFSPGDLERSS